MFYKIVFINVSILASSFFLVGFSAKDMQKIARDKMIQQNKEVLLSLNKQDISYYSEKDKINNDIKKLELDKFFENKDNFEKYQKI